MPYPLKGESLSHYVKKFMGSAEAKQSFPNPKQRYAVSRSLYKRKKG